MGSGSIFSPARLPREVYISSHTSKLFFNTTTQNAQHPYFRGQLMPPTCWSDMFESGHGSSSRRAFTVRECKLKRLMTFVCTKLTRAQGETSVKILTSIREKDVFVVQSGSPKINDSIMELLILISACKGGSANKITGRIILPHAERFWCVCQTNWCSGPTLLSIQQTIQEEVTSRCNHSAYACESPTCRGNQPCYYNRPSRFPNARLLQMPCRQSTRGTFDSKMD